MPDRESQTPAISTAKLIAAVLIAVSIWEFLTALIGDVLVPWVGALLGQNPSLPTTFTKNYDYADLAVSAFELIAAAIVAAIIHYLFSPSKPREGVVPALDRREDAPVPVTASIAKPEPRREEVAEPRLEPVMPLRKVETVLTPQPQVTQPEPAPPSRPTWTPVAQPSPAPAPALPARQPVISPHERARVEPPKPIDPPKPLAPERPIIAQSPAEPRLAPANPFWVPPPSEPKPPAAPVVKAPEPKPEPVKKKKKEKEKQVYYNLVGEPIMDDEE